MSTPGKNGLVRKLPTQKAGFDVGGKFEDHQSTSTTRLLESQFPAVSGQAFAEARDHVLASGQSVLQAESGTIYRVYPDGRKEVVKHIEPPTSAKAIAGHGTIAEAVQYFIADKERRALKPVEVPKLVEQFIAEKTAEGVSALYLADISRRLDKFAGSFKCQVASVKTDEISDWLKTIKATGRNGNNYRNAVCTLFSHARERGHLPREKKTEAELLKRFKETAEEVGIYTPKEIRRVLGAAAGPVRAAIAIGAFAGLRNEEIHRLQWSDINLDAGRIIVSADKAKTAQRRIVPILPNLKAWLEPIKQADGPVGPKVEHLTNFSRNISVACKASGVEMVGNGLRHSFASYRLASVKSADQVALEMGNSPRKLFQNYRELVTPEAATAWFNVSLETLEEADEETPENVVSITKGQAA